MTAPIVYRSDDASAPTLNGTAGSLIAVLDACLVNGYGSKAAAGWTKAFSGTNKAAYRMGAGGTAERMYLRVDDSTTSYASLVGYVSMSDVDTGVERFPLPSQIASLYFYKSLTTNSTPRPWICLATPTAFYLIVEGNQTVIGLTDPYQGTLFFGEYKYDGVGFAHNVMIIAGDGTTNGQSRLFNRQNYNNLAMPAHYLARGYLNFPTSVQGAKNQLHYHDFNSGQEMIPLGHGQGSLIPNPVSGKVMFTSVDVIQPNVRLGTMPGLYAPLVNTSFPNLTSIQGEGALLGKTLLIVMGWAQAAGTGNPAQLAFDLTNWD